MKNWLVNNRERYMGNYHDKTLTMTVGSFSVNALIGIGKLIFGIILLSPWLISTAIYYLILCAIRGQILRKYKKIRVIEDPIRKFDRQYSIYKPSGIFICLLGVSYFLVCLRMYFANESNSYPFYILYGVAAVAFYKISMAFKGMVVTRRMNNPLLSTLKIISFVDACVSIVVVQCALLTMEKSKVATVSSALFGMACSALFLVIGIFMLCRKKKIAKSDELSIKDKSVNRTAIGKVNRFESD
jgi:hypothetical protein